jgi:hypothetical protein
MDFDVFLKGFGLWFCIILIKTLIYMILAAISTGLDEATSSDALLRSHISNVGLLIFLGAIYIGHEIRQLRAAVLESKK